MIKFSVTCQSGLMGWQCKLRESYENSYAQFLRYDEIYGIAQRLGFTSAEEAWEKNPTIQGSVNPSDLRVVS